MTDLADRYRRHATRFAEKVAAVPADRWEAPTPCEDWTARDLVEHVIASQGMFEGLVGRTIEPGPAVGVDPEGAVTAAFDQIQAHLEDPATADEEFDGFFGRTTFAAAVDRFLTFDLIVHGWDLARAAGLDDSIAPDEIPRLVEAVEAFGPAMRSPGAIGPPLDPPPGADAQATLIALLGRHP